MRRFLRLCLLVSLSLGGGGCSARALLQVQLKPDQDLKGYPDIEITALDGTSIRSVGLDAGTVGIRSVVVDNGQVIPVGIYLPVNFDGMVRVHAAVVDDGGCKLGDSSSYAMKAVHPGETAYVEIAVTKIENNCPPMMPRPDAGGDGGGTDGGVDRSDNDVAEDHRPDTGEEHPSPPDGGVDLGVTPDAGEEHATGVDAADDEHVCDDASTATPDLRGVPNCADYCEYVTANCKGTNAQYASGDDCVSICTADGWRAGVEMVGNGNTIGCRTAFAKQALTPGLQPMVLATICAGAGENSPMCKDAPDGGPSD